MKVENLIMDLDKPFPSRMTIGEKYEPAMDIEDQAEADRYFDRLVEHCLSLPPARTRAEAEKVQRDNLAYYAGCHGGETRKRIERLFQCAHPVFGAIVSKGASTCQEAYAAGEGAGRAEGLNGALTADGCGGQCPPYNWKLVGGAHPTNRRAEPDLRAASR